MKKLLLCSVVGLLSSCTTFTSLMRNEIYGKSHERVYDMTYRNSLAEGDNEETAHRKAVWASAQYYKGP